MRPCVSTGPIENTRADTARERNARRRAVKARNARRRERRAEREQRLVSLREEARSIPLDTWTPPAVLRVSGRRVSA